MTMVDPNTPPADLDADAALRVARQWMAERLADSHGIPQIGEAAALISIAASLREIANKLS